MPFTTTTQSSDLMNWMTSSTQSILETATNSIFLYVIGFFLFALIFGLILKAVKFFVQRSLK